MASIVSGRGSKSHSWAGSHADVSAHGRQPSIIRIWSNVKHSLVVPDVAAQPETPSDAAGFAPSQAVLLDLGFYQWKPDGPPKPVDVPGLDGDVLKAAAQQEAAAGVEGGLLHLVQVQSTRLAPRMLLFDWPLKACEGEDALLQQLLPGFLDAPGVSYCLVLGG